MMKNGVNVTALAATIGAVRQQPKLAQSELRAQNQWDTGGHNVAIVDDFHGTFREMGHRQPFAMHAEEAAIRQLLRKSLVYDTRVSPLKIRIEVEKV